MLTVKKFNKISDIIYTQMPWDKYNFVEEGENYDAVLVRSADLNDTAFPAELLAIARAGAVVNNIPVDRCAQQGIVVFNTPCANANAVKELVLCGMMLACRRIIPGAQWVQQQHEQQVPDVGKRMEKVKNNFVGQEIAGKKLGVIGLGAIGIMVANAAIALEMDVYGYDPYLSVDSALRLSRGVHLVKDPQEIYKNCDFITLHLPQTAQTKGMINNDTLGLMKDGAVLLNFARGGLVEDEALLTALESGKLGRYVTDFPDDRIIANENVIALPHLGASTPEAEENCARMAAAQLEEYIVNGNIVNSVNFPNCQIPRGNGWRLAIINRNVTNMVGQITAILAAEGHNIEHMLNRSRGDWAYTLIDVEAEPSADCVNALSAIDGVVRVRVIG